jgi:hypothetical protein
MLTVVKSLLAVGKSILALWKSMLDLWKRMATGCQRMATLSYEYRTDETLTGLRETSLAGNGTHSKVFIFLPNVKEHATLSARASVDHGVDVEVTEDHVNRAADRGCVSRLVRLIILS